MKIGRETNWQLGRQQVYKWYHLSALGLHCWHSFVTLKNHRLFYLTWCGFALDGMGFMENGGAYTLYLNLKCLPIPGGQDNSEKLLSEGYWGRGPESLQCQEVNRGLFYWPEHSDLELPVSPPGSSQASRCVTERTPACPWKIIFHEKEMRFLSLHLYPLILCFPILILDTIAKGGLIPWVAVVWAIEDQKTQVKIYLWFGSPPFKYLSL